MEIWRMIQPFILTLQWLKEISVFTWETGNEAYVHYKLNVLFSGEYNRDVKATSF